MKLLRRQYWEAVSQVKTHLMTKNGTCAHAGAIRLGYAMIYDSLDKIVILPLGRLSPGGLWVFLCTAPRGESEAHGVCTVGGQNIAEPPNLE